MSADVLNAAEELPVWRIHGINWCLDVPLNAYNAEFDDETQANEAASIAVAVFKGEDYGIFIVMEEGETEAMLGPTMIAVKHGAKVDEAYIPFTHVILANCGYYGESVTMEKVLNEELESIKEADIKNAAAQDAIKEQVAKLKKSLKSKKQ